MSLSTAKGSADTTNREVRNLPDLPQLPSLKPPEQAALANWWRQTKEVLRRMEDELRESLPKAG